MKISGNSPNDGIQPNAKVKGDVSRRFVEGVDLIDNFVPGLIKKSNQKNIEYVESQEGDYFKESEAEVLPCAGPAYIEGQKIFRDAILKNGYVGEKNPPKRPRNK